MNYESEGLTAEKVASAVASAGLGELSTGVAEQFAAYYELLQHWNARLNLTSIRSAEAVLQHHFLECIFCAQQLPAGVRNALDYGSGAGLPGIPIGLCRPEIHVTLAESQGKKASFLREAVRSLRINGEVYSGRVEEMSAERHFDVVTLRAVDRMKLAVESAASRVLERGWLAILSTRGGAEVPAGFSSQELAVPGSERRIVIVASRVPRGT